MNDKIAVTLKDVYLPTSNLKINGIRLREFQEELYKDLDNYNEICLQAPTGSGKTFSLLIMLAKLVTKGWSLPVVGIYPSRVLVYDQAKTVRKTLKCFAGFKDEGNGRFSGKIEVEEDGNKIASTDKIKVTVVELTSEKKKDALHVLMNYVPSSKNYLILLTVPEYPFMYISHLKDVNLYFGRIIEYVIKGVTNRNLGEVFSKPWIRDIFTEFSRYFYGYFFIDEFHLYSGLARASLFTLKRMIDDYASKQLVKPKFVFSSATPSEIQCQKVITAQSSNEGVKIKKKTNLLFHLGSKNPQQDLVDYVSNVKFDKKTMIVLDRVYYIAELCQKMQAGLVWGLDISYGLCKKLQKVEESEECEAGKKVEEEVIVGNNAVSFGVDIPFLDLGFIHAHDAETAIQRIGRFGRHGDGEAEIHVFLEPKFSVVSKLQHYSNSEISFEDFINLIQRVYNRREDDKLDKIAFSMQRSEIIYNAYSILKGISNSEIVYKNGKFYKVEGGQQVESLNLNFHIRPSADDYFKVFAFRAGGLKGKWCKDEKEDKEKQNEQEEDELFTMLRNFKYDVNRQCFTKDPLKQNPEVVIEDIPGEFEHYEKFHRIANPKIIINKGASISLSQISGIQDSYVITLTKMPEWKNFNEMARLVATYESALPACLDNNFNYDKLRCDKIDALLLFI